MTEIIVEEIHSFEEWKSLGRRIHKGQVARSFNNKKSPLFVKSQTYDPADQWKLSNRLGISGPWDDMPH